MIKKSGGGLKDSYLDEGTFLTAFLCLALIKTYKDTPKLII